MTPVGPAADSLPDEPDPLEVPQRALVEAVDLELDAVVVEVEDKMADEQPGGRVGEAAPAERGVEHDPVEVGDAAAAIGDLERQDSGAPVVHLDDEAAVVAGLQLRAAHLLEQLVGLARGDRRHERLHLVVRGEPGHEVDVVGGRAAEAEAVAVEHVGHGRGAAGAASRPRRHRRTPLPAPEPSATPARMRTSPSAAFSVTVSSRMRTP